ncbi:Ribosome-associated heat shock protein implicated in the recycling of the 50S subunit [gamma proteobacterium IMCC1989]|jgi:ribosome-associated heat shock protein Hsp15|nr:Ribosome-associated heat shock protein implicated in the recycling of the 50S subunit [gamma proteobacterium IMCC1989]
MEKIRIDKWLWAARFFKTRSLAKQAIEGGKVHCDGQRVKASKDIVVNTQLTIRQGWDEKTVAVISLSDKRRGAPEAALLYEETPESIEKRAKNDIQRKLLKSASGLQTESRPTKKQRRQIHQFKEMMDNIE